VVHHKNSDFDGLSRWLDVIHSDMCSMHSSTFCYSSEVCDGSQKKYSSTELRNISIAVVKEAMHFYNSLHIGRIQYKEERTQH